MSACSRALPHACLAQRALALCAAAHMPACTRQPALTASMRDARLQSETLAQRARARRCDQPPTQSRASRAGRPMHGEPPAGCAGVVASCSQGCSIGARCRRLRNLRAFLRGRACSASDRTLPCVPCVPIEKGRAPGPVPCTCGVASSVVGVVWPSLVHAPSLVF